MPHHQQPVSARALNITSSVRGVHNSSEMLHHGNPYVTSFGSLQCPADGTCTRRVFSAPQLSVTSHALNRPAQASKSIVPGSSPPSPEGVEVSTISMLCSDNQICNNDVNQCFPEEQTLELAASARKLLGQEPQKMVSAHMPSKN